MLNEEEELDKIEDMIREQRERWNKVIDNLSARLNEELKESIDLTAAANALRQKIMSEISTYTMKIIRLVYKLRIIKKAKFEYYATKYQIKVNTTEKNLLIDADTSTHQAKIDMMDNHINFLRECGKAVDHVIWGVKNKVEMYKITGLD